MTLLIAVLYHIIVALIDVAVKGNIKKKYNWDWDKVPEFWKSKNKGVLSWEPMLFSVFYLLLSLLLYLLPVL